MLWRNFLKKIVLKAMVEMTKLGLMALTRKRKGKPIRDTLL